MRINDVEKLLGITKANIRFYEKEGLLTPIRTENGYREYSDADITRLKEIVILRKLGIPVQQVADILDGALPLQDALDSNIQTLKAEIAQLNGSLALCKQLKAEEARMLDAERYWDIIQNQEPLGFRFQSLAEDYIYFVSPTLSWLYWVPEDAWHNPLHIGKYLLGWSLLFAVFYRFVGKDFGESIISRFFGSIGGIVFWGILFLPIYIISKRNPKLADWITNFLMIAAPIAAFLLLALMKLQQLHLL